jgi:G3E family GTPase
MIQTGEQAEARNAIPVTIVTGWLGAGKTTMISNLLREAHGLKILVIENEV